MPDYQVEFVFRDITEEEARNRAGELHEGDMIVPRRYRLGG